MCKMEKCANYSGPILSSCLLESFITNQSKDTQLRNKTNEIEKKKTEENDKQKMEIRTKIKTKTKTIIYYQFYSKDYIFFK